jgi:hypothetical protein
MGVLILSIFSYILRFFIYATIKNPWGGLPAEALRGCTFAAMWASSTYYTHRISPPGLSATMVRPPVRYSHSALNLTGYAGWQLGFLNGVYGGLGQSAGALIGGSLQARFGTAQTFVVAGCIDIVILSLFTLYWALHPSATKLKEP